MQKLLKRWIKRFESFLILKKECENQNFAIFGVSIIDLVGDVFDKFSKLYFRLDAQTEIQILNRLYISLGC